MKVLLAKSNHLFFCILISYANTGRTLLYPGPSFSRSCIFQSLFFFVRHFQVLQIQRPLSHLLSTLILSRLDYCNSLLDVQPRSTTAALQRIWNAIARLVLSMSLQSGTGYHFATGSNCSWRLLTYKAQRPSYIVTSTNDDPARHWLRYAETTD